MININIFKKKESREDKTLRLQKEFLAGMKEIVDNSNDQALRNRFSNLLSGGYDFADTLHQIYEDFGYPQTLEFSNFWNMYRRFGVAKSGCEIPVDFTWLDTPEVDGGETFNNLFNELAKRIKFWKRLKGLDNRQRVGRYAGLFVRVKDAKIPSDEMESLSSIDQIVSITPLYEGQLRVVQQETDMTSERFEQPTIYEFKSSTPGNRNDRGTSSFNIHHTRIIPAAEGADDGSIYGVPAQECVFNDLMDLRKVSGAGGEGFYQNTRNAPQITSKDDFNIPTGKDLEKLEEQLDEYLNKWRKRFISEGLEFNYPEIVLDNPKDHSSNAKDNISAGFKIPHKLLFGTQSGKLAADQDGRHFLSGIMTRRENFASEMIEDTINWFVTWNVLPEPKDLEIIWTDLLATGDDEKLELSKKMSEVNLNQFRAGGGLVFSEEQIAITGGIEQEEIDLPDENEGTGLPKVEDDDEADDE